MLAERGHHVEYCAPVVFGTNVGREVIEPPVTVVHLPGIRGGWHHYLRMPLLGRALWLLFKRKRYEWDLVWLLDTDLPTQMAYLTSRVLRLPAFLYHRGRTDLLSHWGGRGGVRRILRPILTAWFRWSLPKMVARMPVVVTGGELLELHRPHARHLHGFISSLVRASTTSPVLPDRKGHRERTILFLSRVAPLKGIEDLLQALANVESDLPLRLRVVGPSSTSEFLASLQELARNYGVEGMVDFVGPIAFGSELWDEYLKADVYVLPSLFEGTPKTILEAMATGLPVVATRVGGVPDLLDDEVEGYLIPPSDHRALAQALTRLLTDADLRQAMGKAALRKAQALNLDSQLDQLEAFLVSVYPVLAAVDSPMSVRPT